jgi:tRNA(fMet)-specific endonuclease VapC
MIHFLDTNIFVAALPGTTPGLRERIMALPPDQIRVPHQVHAEFLVGAAKSARPEHHRQKVETLLAPFEIVWPDSISMTQYISIRTILEKNGSPIGEADLWIAASARSAGVIQESYRDDKRERWRIPIDDNRTSP